MIDVKKTIDSSGKSQYWFAKQLDRPARQINRWYLGHHNPRKSGQEKIKELCLSNGFTIFNVDY